ncbi:hypothetical protein [Corallococcus terminator]|uniref:Thioredoxin domain-containing protein n=1 Tax=Corallococcus terminator TaxID=2316733 RepID=A0A3A8HN83_9BACT|nr:hypothetical protein [Corallococcus terminator]RKG72842.1 hypothetical protein D7V88_37480 [Corallococcus terminator]
MLAVLGALGLTVCALSCGAIVLVLDFARPDARATTAHPLTSTPPPPLYGQLPPFTLRSDQGAPFDTRRLRGHLALLQFASGPDDTGARHFESLPGIQARLKDLGVPLQVVLVESRPVPPSDLPPPSHGWRRLWDGARLESSARRLGQAVLPADAFAEDLPWTAWVLVDQAGGVRGFYDLLHDTTAAGRLVEDAGCLLTCGPIAVLDPPATQAP